jgi:nicotinamidase-related amidase
MTQHGTLMRELADKLDPAHTALVIVDMENDFVHSDGKAAVRGGRPLDHIHAIVPRIRELLDAARVAGALIVHIQHTTLADDLSNSGPWLDARMKATYSAVDVCLAGTWGQQIIDELQPREGEAVVQKYRYGAFVGTNLDLLLRSADIRTAVCCGAATNVCVEATAREAFSHEYYVVLPRQACASWNASLHEASLMTAAHRYASVCDVDEILEVWDRHG